MSGLEERSFPSLDFGETTIRDSLPASQFRAQVQSVFSVHFSC